MRSTDFFSLSRRGPGKIFSGEKELRVIAWLGAALVALLLLGVAAPAFADFILPDTPANRKRGVVGCTQTSSGINCAGRSSSSTSKSSSGRSGSSSRKSRGMSREEFRMRQERLRQLRALQQERLRGQMAYPGLRPEEQRRQREAREEAWKKRNEELATILRNISRGPGKKGLKITEPPLPSGKSGDKRKFDEGFFDKTTTAFYRAVRAFKGLLPERVESTLDLFELRRDLNRELKLLKLNTTKSKKILASPTATKSEKGVAGKIVEMAERHTETILKDLRRIQGFDVVIENLRSQVAQDMDKRANREIERAYGFHKDPVLEERLTGLVKKLKVNSRRPDEMPNIKIVDRASAAFVAKSSPNTIYVARKFIDEKKPSDDALMVLLGHELSHQELDHGFADTAFGKYNEIAANVENKKNFVKDVARMVVGPKYISSHNDRVDAWNKANAISLGQRSQYLEHEADVVGVDIAIRSGAKRKGITELFGNLRSRSDPTRRKLTDFEERTRTHPLREDRKHIVDEVVK